MTLHNNSISLTDTARTYNNIDDDDKVIPVTGRGGP
jgi:hypothetical protein